MMENENVNREKAVACALYAIPKLGSKKLNALLSAAGSPEGILKLGTGEAGKIIKADLLNDVIHQYENNPEGLIRRMESFYGEYKNKGIDFTYAGSGDFPKRLLHLQDCPFGLFFKGRLPDEKLPSVAVIGARECSEYGRKTAELFGKVLGGSGVQIISGMARGVDGISQRSALSVGGKSYGILGSGVDICYPKENRELYDSLCENGGVISEYLPGTAAKSTLFPARNRIISALCDILLVVEARKKSGTYITVCQALEQGKEIFAIPGRITDALSDGCNSLIKDGAGMASDPEAILDALSAMGFGAEGYPGRTVENAETGHYTADEEGLTATKGNGLNMNSQGYLHPAILRILEETPKSVEEILKEAAVLGIEVSYSDLLCALTELCVSGKAVGTGNYYSV